MEQDSSNGDSRMTIRSTKSVSGWVYALLATIVTLFLVLFGQQIASMKRQSSRFPVRTNLVAAVEAPTAKAKITAEPLVLGGYSEGNMLAHSEVRDFRTPAMTSLAMLEPTGSVKISAPVARPLSSPFEANTASPQLASQRPTNSPVPSQTVSATTLADPQADAKISSNDPLFQRRSIPASTQINRNWPLASSLIAQSMALSDFDGNRVLGGSTTWTEQVQQLFENFAQIPITSERSAELLRQAGELSGRGFAWSESNLDSSTEKAMEVARVAHGIQRRAIVWDRIYQCLSHERGKAHSASSGSAAIAESSTEQLSEKLIQDLAIIRNALRGTSDAQNWADFLLLDRIEELANGSMQSESQQIALAQEFLGRLTYSRVSGDQKKVLASREVQKIAEDLRPLTALPVDYRKVLLDIESIEESSVHRCSEDIAETIQSLRFADSELQYAIANALNQQYRSANVRLSVSEEFINRLLPKDQVTSRPVQQKILGAETRGASQIQTNLRVDFLPDPTAWKLGLNLDGNIQANTRSSRSGATFYNSSNAKVQSAREVRIDPTSLSINGQPANVQSQESLRKFSTNWDQMPIIGDMFRYVAHQEFIEKKPVAKRISQRLIAKQTDDEFDKQLQTKIDSAQEQFDKRLIGPLHSLELQPMILDMQSTDTRLVARYRVAGVNQIAAYTPRPMAPSDSLLSLQLHQSAINNLISQAIPTDRDWTVRQLADKIAEILQLPPFALPEDTPEDVIIRFMDVHPMTVEFSEGRMWLTLRIASFEQTGRIQLKNFTVKTSYIPKVEGLRASLERDALISVDGHRLGSKDRFPIRAIFSKVFAGNSSVPMVSESLASNPLAQGMLVSQLQMEQGWMGIAVSADGQTPSDLSIPAIVDPIAQSASNQAVR
ncbi:MAG: hypothetical protein LW720_09585 [Pirellula sp.]|nr:hypothetical protein [Pirellula sp.]